MREPRLLDRRGAASAAGVIGVPVGLQARVGRRLQKKRDILAPIAGDHAIGARRLDLGDIGGEIGDLEQRMQFVADDLDVRTLFLQHGAGLFLHRLSEGIILIDEIDLLDVRPVLHEVRQRRHLDVGIGVPAEMPVGAFVVGQHGIDRGVVEIDDLLAGVAVIVFADPVGQGRGHRRAVSLGDDADALVGGLLRLNQALLRIGLVVQPDDFDLLAEEAAGGVDLVGEILERLEADFADRRAAPGEGIDITDLDRVVRERRNGDKRKCQRDAGHVESHRVLPGRRVPVPPFSSA